MVYLDWDSAKNLKLKAERDVSFEDILIAFNEDRVLDRIDNPNQKKYPEQKILMVRIDDYMYAVPYIEKGSSYFLKTIYPSRLATKKYLKKGA